MAAPGARAASRFTLVVDGKIVTVGALDAAGGRMPSLDALSELTKALPGASLSADAGSGVVSISRAGAGGVAASLGGFKAGALTIVVDGKIQKSSCKTAAGAAYLPAKDLAKVAGALGFKADLDAGAGVLALGSPSAPAVAAATAEPTGRPAYGMNGTFMQSIAAGGGSSTAATSSGGGSVCTYMDQQKVIWLATEPSQDEKETFQRLASLWTEGQKNHAKGNPADLKLFEDTLRGFDSKVRQRLQGTKDSNPPAAAQAWKEVSLEFLENTEQIMTLALDLVRVEKEPDAQQRAEIDSFKNNIEKIKKLQVQNQSIGTNQVTETVRVRQDNGCAPP
jgi:hypothetical protein